MTAARPAYPSPAYPGNAELHARQLAEHRARAVAAARAAAAEAARHGARVTVFGALAEGRFHRASDLDLALGGPAERLAALAEAIAALVERHDIDADVVRLDQAPPRLAVRIREHGLTPPPRSDGDHDLTAARDLAAKAAGKDAALPGLAPEAREDANWGSAIPCTTRSRRSSARWSGRCRISTATCRAGGALTATCRGRAARAMPGRRPAILTAETRRELGLLVGFRHAFRHGYGGTDHVLARPNVAVAAAAEIEALGVALKRRPAR